MTAPTKLAPPTDLQEKAVRLMASALEHEVGVTDAKITTMPRPDGTGVGFVKAETDRFVVYGDIHFDEDGVVFMKDLLGRCRGGGPDG
jgi:hypothetical protein